MRFINSFTSLTDHINFYATNSKIKLIRTCVLMTLKDVKRSWVVNCENANIMIIATSRNQPTRIEVIWRYDAHTRHKI